MIAIKKNIQKHPFLYSTGGITIFFKSMIDNKPGITMLVPFCLKDLEIRSLVDRLNDLNQCVTLYPDIPKNDAFSHPKPPTGNLVGTHFRAIDK